MVPPIHDRFGRPLRSLRISVTDRCNLRCQYCMPEPEYAWLPRETLLTFDELATVAGAFTGLGVDRIRITGGEPLLRRNLPALVERLARTAGLADLAMTTNGVLLAPQAATLKAAGLRRITVSLDTLHRTRFKALAGFDEHASVFAGIDAAARAGFESLKIDTVIVRSVNDDELVDMIEFGRHVGAEVRFIEYMDVGGATRWNRESVVSRREILEALTAHYGTITPEGNRGSAPAERYLLPDGTTFGIIASTTEPFCESCDRSRLTADGIWLMCLYARAGTDLRRPLRAGATPADLQQLIRAVWTQRADRGAEERLALDRRDVLIPVSALKKDAHLEMHTRGG
jgi:cyclic pyranopterin phosphate synthase